jgi:hypothetical protein
MYVVMEDIDIPSVCRITGWPHQNSQNTQCEYVLIDMPCMCSPETWLSSELWIIRCRSASSRSRSRRCRTRRPRRYHSTMPITMMRSSAIPPTDDPMMTTARFDCAFCWSTGLGFWNENDNKKWSIVYHSYNQNGAYRSIRRNWSRLRRSELSKSGELITALNVKQVTTSYAREEAYAVAVTKCPASSTSTVVTGYVPLDTGGGW